MENIKSRIALAVEATRRLDFDSTTGESYWSKTVAQRLSGGAGSIVLGVVTPRPEGEMGRTHFPFPKGREAAALEAAILDVTWEEYSHEALLPGTSAFVTWEIYGRLGIVSLASLPTDTVVTLDDRKNTGKVSATVKGVLGQIVDFTVIILGTEDGVEVVFTFHPGAPVSPSQIQCETGMHGKQVSVAEAIGMGLTMAKIVLGN